MTEFYTRAEYNKLATKLKSRELTIERLKKEIKTLKDKLKNVIEPHIDT